MADQPPRRVPPPRRSDLPHEGEDAETYPEVGGRRIQPGDLLGEYEIVRFVGSGGMAHVLLAEHPQIGPVALKILKRSRLETGLSRFRREYRALSRVHHRNVIEVYDYGDLDGHPYIAMEYIEGPDLHTVIRGFRDLVPADRNRRARRILADLCRAMSAIHRRGLVHRDLKPSNILVTHDGVCKLTDFGIVKDLDPDNTPELSTTLAGTWAYAAPEHIGGRPVDHRSDLYALGVILFVMLTGRRPFVADGMAGYLKAHRDETPPRPSDLVPDVDPQLDAICMRLLEKAPRDRFQSAHEILYRLEIDDPEAQPAGDWQPPLVGQPEARSAIDDAVAALTDGRGGVLRLLGPDGTGRSRWLGQAEERARQLGVPHHLYALAPDDPPFNGALQLGRMLAAELDDHPAGEELARIVRTWASEETPDGDARYTLYDALTTALSVLLEDRPRVLLLDDLDHLSAEDADLLRYLLRRLIHEQSRPLLVVTAESRSDDLPAWATGLPVRTVVLGPLGLASLTTIVESMLGPGRLTNRLAKRLHAETDGNALFVVQFLRSLIARGVLERAGERWRPTVDADDLISGHLEIPPSIRQLLQRRLENVDEASQEVLRALAVAGAALDLDVLMDVLEADEDDLLDEIDVLMDRGLVQEIPRGEDLAYNVVHSKLGELVQQQLPAERARDLHARLGDTLAATGRQDPDTLVQIGEHLRLGGQPGRAFAHLTAAARRLVDRSLLAPARETVNQALPLREAAREELGAAFAMHDHDQLYARGLVLANRGRWASAVAVFEEMLDAAIDREDAVAAGQARLQLARARRRTGDFEGALSAAETTLKDARARHDRGQVANALHALAMLSWIDGDMDRCEKLADEGLLLCTDESLRAERAQLHIARAAAQATRGQLASAARGMGEAESLLDALRMRQPWVLALANLGEVLLWQGEPHTAWDKANTAVQTAEALDYALGRVVALRTRGTAALDLGRSWEGATDLLRARQLGEEFGVHEERLAVSAVLTRHALDVGDPNGAILHASRGLQALEDGGRDPELHLPVLQAYLAQAMIRRDPGAAARLLRAVEDAVVTLPGPRAIFTRMAAARAWQAAGDRSRAIEHCEQILATPHARSFRLLTLEIRALLGSLTTGEVRRRHLRMGQEQLRAYLATLPPELAITMRARVALSSLDSDSSGSSLSDY